MSKSSGTFEKNTNCVINVAITVGLLLKFINKQLALIGSSLFALIALIAITFPHETIDHLMLIQLFNALMRVISEVATFSLILDIWKDTKLFIIHGLFSSRTIGLILKVSASFAMKKIAQSDDRKQARLTILSYQLIPMIFFLTLHIILWIFNVFATRERANNFSQESCESYQLETKSTVIKTSGQFYPPKRIGEKTCRNPGAVMIGVIVFAALEAILGCMNRILPQMYLTKDMIEVGFFAKSSLIAAITGPIGAIISMISCRFIQAKTQLIISLLIVTIDFLWWTLVQPVSPVSLIIGLEIFRFGFFAIRPCVLYLIEKTGHLSSLSIGLFFMALTFGPSVPIYTENYHTYGNIDKFISLNSVTFNLVIIFIFLIMRKAR